MRLLFKNTLLFSFVFFLIFILDIFIKVFYTPTSFRYLTKLSLVLLLLIYYLTNQEEKSNIRKLQVILALTCFIIGDFFLIGGDVTSQLVAGGVFFCIAKVCYALRFSNKKDFEIRELIPFLLFCFAYITTVMMVVYRNLGIFFLPILFYLFVVMLTAQFAYLRKNEVNTASFWLVLLGVILSMFSDSINILKEFYRQDFAYNEYTVMLFYGFSQYFIVLGIVKENRKISFKYL
ncbi:lysoplasmalogenase family protein [Lacinutrix chionoecetis]